MVKLQNTNSGNSGYLLMGTTSLVDVGVQFSGTEDTRLRVGRYNNGTPCLTIYHKADGVGKYYNVYSEYNKPTASDVGAATESFVTNKIAEAQLSSGGDIDLSGYATKDELNAAINTVQSAVDNINNINYDAYLAFDTTEIV
jgi:hypothetical protein